MLDSMLLWVTRSWPFNLRTCRGVIASGHRAVTVPVLHIRPTGLIQPTRDPSVVIFTSGHAVEHHRAEERWLSVPVFTVGDQTAVLAQQRGYRDVRSADGNVSDLRDLILGSVSRFGHAVHFGAQEPAGILVDELQATGLSAELNIVYESVKATPEQLRSVASTLPFLDGIVVHSAKGAEAAAQLVAQARWYGVVFCLSPACAAPFETLPGLLVEIAPAPTEEALLGLLRMFRGWRPSRETSLSETADARPALRLVVSNPSRNALPSGGGADGPDNPPPAAA